jgi:hypothetical protein
MDRENLWEEAVRFHGHSCPGLAIGVRVALDYAAEFGLCARTEDEELVAIVETDACGVDGLQLTWVVPPAKATCGSAKGASTFSPFIVGPPARAGGIPGSASVPQMRTMTHERNSF